VRSDIGPIAADITPVQQGSPSSLPSPSDPHRRTTGRSGDTPSGADIRRALARRLRAIAPLIVSEWPEEAKNPTEDSARLLTVFTDRIAGSPTDDVVWLLLAAVAGAYPTRDEVDDARRAMELSGPEEAAESLLEAGLALLASGGAAASEVRVVVGAVLVDVDFTARHDLHTGVQRVVRQTLPVWRRTHDIIPAAWTTARGALRMLDPVEAARIFEWSPARETHGRGDDPHRRTAEDDRILLPWRSVLVLPEVPGVDVTPRIAALAACSNNVLVAVGHDAIPLISADTVPIDEPRRFMMYLSAIKFAARIAGVSRSAAREFAAYGAMLASQGLPAPVTVAVPLAVEFSAPLGADTAGGSGSMDVVVVGSHDVRKNHLAVLHAAEMLWQQGLQFGLSFLGSGGSNVEFHRRVEVLRHRGRRVEVRTAVSDNDLHAAVSTARFTVFPSLHEGYGLPVAESLSLGTPVITTDYGPTAELATGGGVITIDPRDDAAIASAMRQLLTDDAEIARLRTQIRQRAERSWQVYADELWGAIVEPVLQDLAGPRDAQGR
jgi:glycosyltransferase involved in cell wall biosynthesis